MMSMFLLTQDFFFFKQKTAYEMRISDWSSDVCSSDLAAPADSYDYGNEIIVTASKRSQTLQDTPIAVSVTSAADLQNAQIRDLIDLQSAVPSLRVSQLQSSANTNFIIRGFGTRANNPGNEPSVGDFIDAYYRSRPAPQLGHLPHLQP